VRPAILLVSLVPGSPGPQGLNREGLIVEKV
jgi:hypothetical protein